MKNKEISSKNKDESSPLVFYVLDKYVKSKVLSVITIRFMCKKCVRVDKSLLLILEDELNRDGNVC